MLKNGKWKMITKIYKSLLFFFLSISFTWVPQLKTEGFLAGTLVKTISGYVSIEQLIVGNIVVSYDHKSNCYTQYPITCIACSKTNSYIKIQVNNEYIYASPEQKFYVHNQNKWLPAHALKPTDTLMTVNDSAITINAIEIINQQCTVHSLSIKTNHTFCVSHNDIIAHNIIPIVAQITLTASSAVTPIIQSILPIIQSTVIIGCATLLSKLAQKISHKNRHTTNNTQSISINNNSNGGGWNDPDDDDNNEKKHPNGTYKDSAYHHRHSSGKKSPAPKNGQKCLDNSFKGKSNSEQRVSIENEIFVVLRKTIDREYHGYCVIWEDLHWSLQQVLRDLKVVTKSGKIIKEVAVKVFK